MLSFSFIHSVWRLQSPAWALLAFAALATGADRAHNLAQAILAASGQGQPTITILPAASGAPLQSYTPGNASLSLGRAAYYGGYASPGVAEQKTSASLVLATRFALKVDCGGSPSSLAEVVISLAGEDPSYTVSLDGTKVSAAGSATLLRCGSLSEHRVEVEVPKVRPAGPIGATVIFSATTKY